MKEKITYQRDTKNNENIMNTWICQQIGQPRRNAQKKSRNIQPSKSESGKNRQSEQSDH